MKGVRKARRLSWVALALLLPAAHARGGYAPGCTVALDIGSALHEAHAVVLQPDGKIVVAGYVDFGLEKDILVARFHPDLTLDTSFNGTGFRVDDLQTNDEAYAVALTTDQKIVVAGYSDAGQDEVVFVRYNRDGTRDTSFSGDGIALFDFSPSPGARFRGITVQPDGKVVGAGYLTTAGNQRLVVVRLNKDGSADLTFDGDGAAQPTIGGNYSFATDVLVDPDGRIVVSGERGSTTSDFLAVRLRSDGSLDSTFGGTGWVATDIGPGGADGASSLVRQASGELVLGGTSNGNFALARYRQDGNLDLAFNGTGIVLHNLGGADVGNDVALDAGGNIIIAGEGQPAPANFAFARFFPGGGLDLTKTDDVTAAVDRALGVAITRAGKILLAGSTLGASTPKLTLSLYNPDGTQDCGSFFLHPTASTVSEFGNTGCPNWDCVNDQSLNAPSGPLAPHDLTATMVQSDISPKRELYRLADGFLPAGKVVTEIEIGAQLSWNGTATVPGAQLLYQRVGFDPIPVPGILLTISNTAFFESKQRFSNLNWSANELDALEIGLDHVSGNNLWMTQIYVKVSYGENLARPVDILTAAASGDATSGRVMLNWLNPSYGLYDETVIRRRIGVCPASPADGDPVASGSQGLGNAGSFVDNPPPGSTYFYAAFVEDSEDRFSTGTCIPATPFDRNAGKVEWIYNTSISSLTTPGLRLDVPATKSVVYSVDNNGLVHAIQGGNITGGGGAWPSGWVPFRIGASAQSRPPVVPLPPSSTPALILGAQDGHAYAVNAVTGTLLWKSTKLGASIQAAPAAALSAFSGTHNLVFVGTRSVGLPNRLYALNAGDGTVAWFFDNGGGPTGIGIVTFGPSVDYAAKRVYFTSWAGGSGKTVWCIDYAAAPPPASCWGAGFGVTPVGGGNVEASPILFQGSVFVSDTAPGDLYKINPADGFVLPVSPLGSGGAKGFVFPQLFTQNVFASTSTETFSIDTSISIVNWSHTCVANPSTPIWVPGTDRLYVGSNEGKLFQLSAAAGGICPTKPPSACIGDCLTTIVGAPAFDIMKLMLYAGTVEGKVYGVRTPF